MANKNGPEIHPAVDANNVQAKRNAETFSDATRRAVANATTFAEVLKKRKRKSATLELLVRALVAFVLGFTTVMAKKYGLVEWRLSLFILSTIAAWLSCWAGAWLQFMWGKEGLLK